MKKIKATEEAMKALIDNQEVSRMVEQKQDKIRNLYTTWIEAK